MKNARKVKSISKSVPTMEGAGVHLHRAFGFGEAPGLDPFLLLDDFRSDLPEHYLKGFPWHPHRGIETITYVLKGDVEHGDSLGNHGDISGGDVQWMTAGSGIIHQEMPKGDAQGRMWGFQLWANLPASQKMMEPRYRDVLASRSPEVILAVGGRIQSIGGAVGGISGPGRDLVTVAEYLDLDFAMVITVCDNARERCPIFPGGTAMIHHSFQDPARAEGTEEELLAVFRSVRDQIRVYAEEFARSLAD